MNYLPTCTSRLVVQHPCQVSFKSMQGWRGSWENKLWWDGMTEWRKDGMTDKANTKYPLAILWRGHNHYYSIIFHFHVHILLPWDWQSYLSLSTGRRRTHTFIRWSTLASSCVLTDSRQYNLSPGLATSLWANSRWNINTAHLMKIKNMIKIFFWDIQVREENMTKAFKEVFYHLISW